MTLKSFPTNANNRQLIWCLNESSIDKALKDDNAIKLLEADNITVVQLPLSRLAKKNSKELVRLEEQGLLSHNQFLMLGDNHALEKAYFKVDDVLKDFFAAMLQKASTYQRFFAILGASSVPFESHNYNSSNFEAGGSAELDGLASKISGFDAEIEMQAKSCLKQMTQMSSEYEKKEMSDVERISKAEYILKECCLENDQICKNALATLKDGSKQKKLSLEMMQLVTESRNFKALLNLQAKLPIIDSKEFNLASLKGAIEIANLVDKNFKLNIVVEF